MVMVTETKRNLIKQTTSLFTRVDVRARGAALKIASWNNVWSCAEAFVFSASSAQQQLERKRQRCDQSNESSFNVVWRSGCVRLFGFNQLQVPNSFFEQARKQALVSNDEGELRQWIAVQRKVRLRAIG
jgi:hypothetical protein